MKSIEEFTELLKREMPSGTVISNPEWWATRIHKAFLAAYTEQQEPFAHICVLPTADAGPTKFFTSASDPRGFPVFRHAAPVVPADMVLVPREPTEAMIGNEWNRDMLAGIWRAMIAAGEKS